MNKKLKIIIGILISILILWGIIFFIDYSRVSHFEEPIFVIRGEILRDGGSYKGYGIGYRVEVKKTTSVEYGIQLEKVEMYMFDRFITGAIADLNNNEVDIQNEEMNGSSSESYSFRAIVVSSTAKAIVVKPIEEKDIKILSDKVSIGLDEKNDMLYFKGAELLITYTGGVMESYPTQIKVTKIQTETDYKTKIEELPEDYSFINAIRDNCVVNVHNQTIYNKDELDRFIDNVNNNTPDFIRCISFTTEGGMLITDVNFEGNESYRVCCDWTRDEYSSVEDRTYHYAKFKKIDIEESEEGTSIYLQEAVEGTLNEVIVTGYRKNTKAINNYEFNYLLDIVESENKEKQKITVDELDKKYDYDIYYYGIEKAIVDINNEKIDLIEALKTDKVTMEQIIEQAEKDSQNDVISSDMYKEGGTMIYFYDTYTIIKSHSLDGNRDVYIGVPEMRLNDVR